MNVLQILFEIIEEIKTDLFSMPLSLQCLFVSFQLIFNTNGEYSETILKKDRNIFIDRSY